MKKQFQSKSVPRGTRTIWRYLGALFLLFTFSIGNVWAASDITVKLYVHGGTISADGWSSKSSGTYFQKKVAKNTQFDIPAPTQEGYSFVNWTVNEDGTGDSYTTSHSGYGSNITLHAQWLELPYTPTHLIDNKLKVNAEWNSKLYTTDATNITGLVDWQVAPGKDRTSNVTDKQTGKSDRTPAIFTTSTKEDDNYMYLSFTIASGKRLKLSAVNIPVFGISNSKTTLVEIEDAYSTKISVNGTITKDADGNGFGSYDFANVPYLKGTVTVKMWAYGSADGYRMKTSIYLDGTISDAPTEYAVSFDKNNEGASGTMSALYYEAGAVVTLPACGFTAPTGMEFDAWTSTDVTITSNQFTMPAKAVTIKATWKSAADKYTVHYMDADGTTPLAADELVEVTQKPAGLAEDPTKPLYTFAAWQKDAADIALDAEFWATVVKDAEITLTARWTKAYAQSIDMEQFVMDNTKAGNWHAYLDSKGYAYASSNMSLDSLDGGKTKNNYQYLGLKFNKNSENTYVEGNLQAQKLMILKVGAVGNNTYMKIDGAKVAEPAIVGGVEADSAAAYTYWYYDTDKTFSLFHENGGTSMLKGITITDPFTVTFDANGGEDVASLNGTPTVTLPSATKGTDSFLGWFDGENKVGEAGDTYTPTANITLVAHWEAVSTDARLASISFSSDAGTLAPAFDPEVTNYTYTMPYGTASVPTITGATAVNANAQAPVIGTAATAWGEAQTVKGVAQSGAEKIYTVTILRAPKDGVCIIKGNVGNNTFVIDEDASLFAGTADKNNVRENSSTYQEKIGWKFQARPARLGLTLSGDETFQEGDVVEVFVTSVADIQGNNDKMRIFDANDATAAHVLYESEADMIQGANRFVLPATTTKSLYLHRTNDADYDNFNPYVAYVAVYRPMNPVMTAIQFNETDVEVTSTAVAATLPNGTNLSTMTVTPTIVWNGAGTAAPTAAWAWGANTYRVTDKDGDYTDYTITLTEAVPAVDPTLTYNEGAYMVGTSALDLSTLIDAADSDGEITYTVKDAGATGATITDGKFTATAAGTAIITATQAATVAYNAKTVDFNVVVTVATEIDGIKMVENNALTGNFRVKADQLKTGAYTVEGINYAKYVQMGSTHTSFSGEAEGTQAKGIYYAPTKKNITFWFYMQNTESSTTRKIYVYTIEEGKAITSKTVDVEAGSHLVSTDITLTTNAEIVFGVENTKLCFCQIVAVESGEDLLQGGQNGYVFDYSKKRQNVAQNVVRTIDGIDYKLSAESKINSASNVQLTTLGTHYIKFHLDAPMTVNVYADNKKYYVGTECSTEDAAMTYEATGDGEFTLAAGNWYINGSGNTVKINKLSFMLPKCEKPTIETQPESKQTFGPGNLTATVVAAEPTDGGTLKYQWYNAANDEEVEGATSATLTTTTKGTYYVIVTNTLANHSDNSDKSESATLGYRVMDDATLSVLKYGETAIALENGVYEYDVNLAKGTTEVPALAATATMNGYATVTISNAAEFVNYEASSTVTVKSEDLTETNVYTVNFTVKHDLPQVDVTATTTWDMTNVSASAIELSGSDKNARLLLANIDGVNNTTFNAQALMFEGQHIGRTGAGIKHLAGRYVQFNVTVPGAVFVTFESNGDNARTISINGKKCSRTTSGTAANDYITYALAVEPGSVEIIGYEGESANQYVRISKIEFKAEYSHRRENLNPSYLGTLCWTNNAVLGGATLYEFAGKNEYNYLVFDEVAENRLEAGKPYIFMPENGSTEIRVYNTDNEEPMTEIELEPVNNMYGTFTGKTLVPGQDDEMYYFSASHIWAVKDFVVNINVPAYYCYVDYEAVLAAEPAPSTPAPGRRRVTMGVQGQQVATGIEDVQGDKVQCTKMLINGQLFILRGEKMYDAKGQLVK